ncbi:hypothetical protein [Streptomyces sp. WZ-12]|uniref:hypothetical protein n=1 Tax=Streptomyces sp. WZ-12 TaxID=3030210 RepID=UPI0023817B7B|nr:hypothetical protein [Streptomyces sp. WZ-12]
MAAAKKAVQAEANDEPTTFEFKGVEFTIPAPMDLSAEVLEVIEDGAGETKIMKAIIGEEQWAAYKGLRCTIREFGEFAEKIADAAGFGNPGN